ncbi:MAG: Smr/MutS family protein [Gammaproteobacteria bacterium]|nr:Smr/MutS family protein [Gammaproteobacteria bacterium]
MNFSKPDQSDQLPFIIYPMSADKPGDDKDRDLFLDAIGDVRRLELRHAPPHRKAPKPHPRQQDADDKAVLESLLTDPSEQDLLDADEHLSWARPGVQKAVLRKLRNGRFSIQGELDLHGLTQQQAREELLQFILEARQRQRYCVRIIHGRGLNKASGRPVLKPSINHWLRQHKQVLAFCGAPSHDGGAGAVYVLLRK